MRAMLKAGGITLFEDDGETWRALPDLVKDIVRRVNGETSKLQDIGFGDEAMKVFTAVAGQFDKDTGSFGKLDHLLSITGSGAELMEDAAMKAGGFNAASQNLLTAAQRFADAMNALSPRMQNAVMWAATGIGVGSLGYVGAKRIGGMFGLGRRGKSTDMPSAMGEILSGAKGPMPVMVTNWPPGMGATGVATSGEAGRRRRGNGRATATGIVGRAAHIGGRTLRGIPDVGAGLMALDVGTALAAGDNARAVESATGAGGFWAGAATGGAIGATVGSAVPVIGTAIGGAVGSIAGGIAGSELGAWLGREFNDLVGLNEPAEVNGTIKLEVSSRDDNMDIRVRQASRHGQRNNVDLEVDTGQMMVMP